MRAVRASIYAAIALYVVAQFGFGKYFFLLDLFPMVSKRNLIRQIYFYSGLYGGSLPVKALQLLIPPFIYQRLILFLIIFLSGLSMDVLTDLYVNSNVSKLLASIIYMINPFTYIRILVGHWMFMLSYSLLPLGVKLFEDLLREPTPLKAVDMALVETLISFSSHVFVISLFIYALIALARGLRLKHLKAIALASILYAFLNAYWLIPSLTAYSTGKTILSKTSKNVLEVFAPKGTLFDIFAMYGFWKLGYIYPKNYLYPYWIFIFIILFSFCIYGIDSVTLPYALTLVVGLAFASGIRGPFSGLMSYFYTHTILSGMRDSQKFTAMIVLSYSILCSRSVERIKFRKISIILIILFLIYSYSFFTGFSHQIRTGDFPRDWYKVRHMLEEDRGNYKVLFLPWHLYMWFKWVPDRNKLVANPAQGFFDNVLCSQSAEIFRPSSLMSLFNSKGLSKRLALMGVKYVIVAREGDYGMYLNRLKSAKGFKEIYSGKYLCLFEDTSFKGILLTGNTLNFSSMKPAEFKVLSPVKIHVFSGERYLLLLYRYSPEWRINGAKGVDFKGVCLFKGRSGDIVYTRFYRVNLPSYILSLLAILTIAIWRCYICSRS